MAEEEIAASRHVEIRAGEMLASLGRPAGRPLAVKDRNLADCAGPGHRQSSGRIELPGQNVGDRMSGLAAKKPRRQDGVGALEQPRQRQRAAGRKRPRQACRDQGPPRRARAGVREGRDRLGLPLLRSSRRFAKAQHDDFGSAHRSTAADIPSVSCPAMSTPGRDRSGIAAEPLRALPNGHSVLGAARRRPGSQHLARRRRQRADQGDAPNRRGRAARVPRGGSGARSLAVQPRAPVRAALRPGRRRGPAEPRR